jgi:hypothetical protein
LVTLASSIRGSDAPALYMRVLVAVSVTAWAGASTAAAGTARPAHVRHRRLGRGDARQRREGRVAGDWLSLGGPSPIQAHSELFLPTATPLKTRSKRAKKLARNERISSVLAVVFLLYKKRGRDRRVAMVNLSPSDMPLRRGSFKITSS